MRLPFTVIDADGHVLEHAVDWAARLPARFRKDAPGWVTLPDGDRHFMVERKTWPTRRDFYGDLGLWPEPHKAAHLWSWEREGQWDPVKRLPDMDEEGIDYAHWDCICPDSVKAIATQGPRHARSRQVARRGFHQSPRDTGARRQPRRRHRLGLHDPG